MKCAIAPSPAEPRSSAEFERMRQSTQRRAYAMALQMTRSVSDAEDLVQDTYVKAWRFFDSYHPGRPFLNWLLRIMQRAYLDSLRRENPIRRAESLNAMVSPSDGEVQEIPIADSGFNAEQELLMEEFAKELQNALKELPEVYRKAIVLCDIEELSYQEIAERQGTTVGTVRSRIHRGRRMLREAAMRKGLQIPVR
ncbi:MAG: sigma-70 family RNA polymerase sigma factor [Fimbriimonadaceae bacterium]|nr:sigma-70 family RNA polymerase sigma factor [Fimbriimonadaceae bacterium]QYK57956.1 MAG: sigma-70 family RNA polymerase sigma factor [Fimbriimonadaceae bacterium]